MLVNTKKMLEDARKNNYAIGAYNVFNLESIKAIANAVRQMKIPVIFQASESAVNYAGAENLVAMIKNETKDLETPVAINLDHGKDIKIIETCLKAGFTSIMIDASALPYQENVEKTKKIVKMAKKYGATVEAELGELKGVEDNVSSLVSHHTNPIEALKFINDTKVDSLAVSIGTAHGVNKGKSKLNIRFDILKELEKMLPKDFPLVCHGASSVNKTLQDFYTSSGGVLLNPQGTSIEDLHKMAITTPIAKINIDTDLRLVFTGAFRKSLNENIAYNPRTHLKNVMTTVSEYVVYLSSKVFK